MYGSWTEIAVLLRIFLGSIWDLSDVFYGADVINIIVNPISVNLNMPAYVYILRCTLTVIQLHSLLIIMFVDTYSKLVITF